VLSASVGNNFAILNIGTLFYLGKGVEQNYFKAFEWYKKATQNGDGVAQFFVGRMYRDGLGIHKDNVLAHAWFNVAAALGNEEAKLEVKNLELSMQNFEIQQSTGIYLQCRLTDFKNCLI